MDQKKKPDTELTSLDDSEKLKQIESVVENSPGMVYQFVMEPNGEMYFTFVSRHSFEIMEIHPDKFKENPAIMLEMMVEEDRARMTELTVESAKNLTKFWWQGWVVSGKGKMKYIEARSIPRKLKNGNILWDGLAIDKTPLVQLKEKLDFQRGIGLQNAKLTALGQMSAGIAHEINNPLAIIKSSLQLLQKKNNFDVNSAKKLDSAERSIERISKVLSGLKKFSRHETTSNICTVNFMKILEEVIALASLSSMARDVSISFDVDFKSELKVDCDEIEMEQVFFNLIHNAIDAAFESEEKEVKILVSSTEEILTVRIVDSGPGLNEKSKQNLFVPFYTTKPVGKGTGLGLSIASGIVESHNGEIYFDEKAKQTTFIVKLPIKAKS